MRLLIGAVIISILFATQSSIRRAYTEMFQERFSAQVAAQVEGTQVRSCGIFGRWEGLKLRNFLARESMFRGRRRIRHLVLFFFFNEMY